MTFVLVKGQCVECHKFLIGPTCTTCVQLVCGLCQKAHEQRERLAKAYSAKQEESGR